MGLITLKSPVKKQVRLSIRKTALQPLTIALIGGFIITLPLVLIVLPPR